MSFVPNKSAPLSERIKAVCAHPNAKAIILRGIEKNPALQLLKEFLEAEGAVLEIAVEALGCDEKIISLLEQIIVDAEQSQLWRSDIADALCVAVLATEDLDHLNSLLFDNALQANILNDIWALTERLKYILSPYSLLDGQKIEIELHVRGLHADRVAGAAQQDVGPPPLAAIQILDKGSNMGRRLQAAVQHKKGGEALSKYLRDKEICDSHFYQFAEENPQGALASFMTIRKHWSKFLNLSEQDIVNVFGTAHANNFIEFVKTLENTCMAGVSAEILISDVDGPIVTVGRPSITGKRTRDQEQGLYAQLCAAESVSDFAKLLEVEIKNNPDLRDFDHYTIRTAVNMHYPSFKQREHVNLYRHLNKLFRDQVDIDRGYKQGPVAKEKLFLPAATLYAGSKNPKAKKDLQDLEGTQPKASEDEKISVYDRGKQELGNMLSEAKISLEQIRELVLGDRKILGDVFYDQLIKIYGENMSYNDFKSEIRPVLCELVDNDPGLLARVADMYGAGPSDSERKRIRLG